MDRREVALGRAVSVGSGTGSVVKPISLEDRMTILESKIDMAIEAVGAISEMIGLRGNAENKETNKDINKDGIPYHINLIGNTRGVPYILTVEKDAYYVGHTPYRTLSAAAEGVSGSRRSGWMFWCLPDGRTAKEAFNRK